MYLVNCWTSTLSVDLVKILILTLPPRPTAQHSRALQHDRLQRAESVLTAGSPVATVLCWDVSQLAGLWLLQCIVRLPPCLGTLKKLRHYHPVKALVQISITSIRNHYATTLFGDFEMKSLCYHPVKALWKKTPELSFHPVQILKK